MLNVVFDIENTQYDAIEDWQCYPMHFEIGGAVAKYRTIDIPYRDGLLHVEESFGGGVHYNNRTIGIDFLIMAVDHATTHSTICNTLNGKKAKVFLSTDPDWYYYGYINVENYYSSDWQWIFTMVIDEDPYKYSVEDSEVKSL